MLSNLKWSTLECKFILGLLSYSSITSCYILVFLTINRYLAVCFPLVSKTFDILRKTRLIFSILVIGTFIFCIPVLYAIDFVPFLGCINFGKSGELFVKIYSVVYIVIGSIIPFCILLFLNLSIIHAIRNRRKNLSKYSGSEMSSNPSSGDCHMSDKQPNTNNHTAESSQITRMLLFVTCTFLILTFPHCLRFLVFSFIDNLQSPYIFSVYYLYFFISSRMYGANAAVNFYLYCICGARFRKDVKELFTIW